MAHVQTILFFATLDYRDAHAIMCHCCVLFLQGLTIIWIWALYSRKTYGTVSQFLLMITHNFLSVISNLSIAGQNNQQPMLVVKPCSELLNDCWIGGCVGRKSSTLCRICVRVQDVSALSGYNFLLPMRIGNTYRQCKSIMQIANKYRCGNSALLKFCTIFRCYLLLCFERLCRI